MQERHSKELCFNCDDKFVPSHHCKSKPFLLLLEDNLDTTHNSSPPDALPNPSLTLLTTNHTQPSPPELDTNLFHLSTTAITGSLEPHTLQLNGTIGDLHASILVDNRSSGNIIQPRLATHLNLTITPISNFFVMVRNGASIPCLGFCPQASIVIQSYTFWVDFYVMGIQAADIVFGFNWLCSISPFLSNYKVP
ncbi:hypothetical protein Scep_014897 [Stephania cephalantha]|uniref:Uncharacterized protein n=1 Tax=Stephania cephalantha TaxID=152367 RepID=A0AAP0J214_9MAGN